MVPSSTASLSCKKRGRMKGRKEKVLTFKCFSWAQFWSNVWGSRRMADYWPKSFLAYNKSNWHTRTPTNPLSCPASWPNKLGWQGFITDINFDDPASVSGRSPSPGACSYLISLSRRFHRPIYFWFKFISSSDPRRNLSDQLQSQARTNVDMSTLCRRIHVRPHIVLSLPKRAHVDWNWPLSREKKSKNRLVCKND